MGKPKVTPLLEVRKSKIHGKGVFAGENIDKGVLLCVCPVLLVPVKDPSNDGILGAYYYEWSETNHALVLGLVSLVNHSYKPNAKVYTVNSNKTMQIYSLKSIRKGEELLVNYGKQYPYLNLSAYRT